MRHQAIVIRYMLRLGMILVWFWLAAVKLSSLIIQSSGTEGRGPKSIRLFKNTPSIGFGEAENAPAVQEFELTEKDLEGEALTLR